MRPKVDRKKRTLLAVIAAAGVAAVVVVAYFALEATPSLSPPPAPVVIAPVGTTWHLGLGANGRPLNATVWFNLTRTATVSGSFGTTQEWYSYGYLMNESQWRATNRTWIGDCAPWSTCWTYVSDQGSFNESTSSSNEFTPATATLNAGTWLLFLQTTGNFQHQSIWVTSPIVASYS